MGKLSCTLFIKPDGGDLADFCRRYIKAINSNYEYGGPAEKIAVDEHGSLKIVYWPDADPVDGAVVDALVTGFRDGWQAAMMFLSRATECDSAYVAWMFSQANPDRRGADPEPERALSPVKP